MALIGMKEMLQKAYTGGYGIGGFDGFDSISILAALEESKARNAPSILICAPVEYQALSARGVADTARVLSDMVGIDTCLHLDHARDFESVVEAIKGGFSSVMIDASRLSFDENIALTRRVVEYAHDHGVPVEAELGAVGRVDATTHEGTDGDSLTDPEQAAEFVEKSGCDFLAVSIGNAHGLYTAAPNFNFRVLEAIHHATPVPLVLHGGSGTPEDQLKRAVSMGMAKVNVASEIGQAFTQTYIEHAVNQKMWWATAKNEAKTAMRKVIGKWIERLGSEGQG